MTVFQGYSTVNKILGSIVVSIPACHAGDRGSIPRRGGCFVYYRFFGLIYKFFDQSFDFKQHSTIRHLVFLLMALESRGIVFMLKRADSKESLALKLKLNSG